MGSAALQIDGTIATLALAGPLDATTVAALGDACARVAEDASLRVLVLGGDAAAWGGWSAGAQDAAESLGLIGDPFGPLAALPQPSVAALAGEVRDAGLELALCADVRVAAADARLGLPSLLSGAFPLAGGLQRLARAVGRSRAADLAIGGEFIDAETALTWGLVSAVAANAEVDAQARAAQIAARGPLATRLVKEALRRGAELPLAEALRMETDLTILLQTTADRAEGVRAFLEKRPPLFAGH